MYFKVENNSSFFQVLPVFVLQINLLTKNQILKIYKILKKEEKKLSIT